MSAPSTSILHALFTRRHRAFPGMGVAKTAQALVERGHVGGITAGTGIVDRIVAEGGRELRDPLIFAGICSGPCG
jgi:hypothetical protein